jgi:hypothetical protein
MLGASQVGFARACARDPLDSALSPKHSFRQTYLGQYWLLGLARHFCGRLGDGGAGEQQALAFEI